MTATLMDNEEPDLSVADCKEYLDVKVKGQPSRSGAERFAERRDGRNERIGQAWFNCLTVADQDKLRGNFFDPFDADNWPTVIKALRFLLEN